MKMSKKTATEMKEMKSKVGNMNVKAFRKEYKKEVGKKGNKTY